MFIMINTIHTVRRSSHSMVHFIAKKCMYIYIFTATRIISIFPFYIFTISAARPDKRKTHKTETYRTDASRGIRHRLPDDHLVNVLENLSGPELQTAPRSRMYNRRAQRLRHKILQSKYLCIIKMH